MQNDLHIDPAAWGWVVSVFTLSYCLFELPTGLMGDRFGPRRTLSRIVVWWSTFTALTGMVTRYPSLLLTRFLFGAGEAGAFPNTSIVVARWFPLSQRATLSGVCLAASQIGGALAPLIVLPVQLRWGWRASFFVLGTLGVFWAGVWHMWFRDTPAEKLGIATPLDGEDSELAQRQGRFSMRAALQSKDILAVLAVGFCYIYVYNFFQSWFHTFLEKGRGFAETELWLSALPYVVGACGNLFGGTISDTLVKRLGRRNGRRVIGIFALLMAAAAMATVPFTPQKLAVIALLCIAYGAITFQQSVAFGVCLDLGHARAGAIVGLFNTLCQVGGLVGQLAYGYLVEWFGSYDLPFYPMVALLLFGAYQWSRIDASRTLNVAPMAEQSVSAL